MQRFEMNPECTYLNLIASQFLGLSWKSHDHLDTIGSKTMFGDFQACEEFLNTNLNPEVNQFQIIEKGENHTCFSRRVAEHGWCCTKAKDPDTKQCKVSSTDNVPNSQGL